MDRISALMDGELDELDGQREIARLKTNEELRSCWDEFHLVRDALRGEPLLSSGFNEKLSRRLSAEPTVLAPRRIPSRPRRVITYAMSAAASVAAVAFVVMAALGPTGGQIGPVAEKADQPKPQLATLQAPQAAMPPPVVQPASVPVDGRMNAYLLAHEGFSPSTTLQGVVPYIRTVSASRPAGGR